MVYTMEYELSFANNYKWSKCRKCFNWVTGREIKQAINIKNKEDEYR